MYIVQIVPFHTNDTSPCILHDLVQPIANISNSDGWSLFWEVEGETYGGGHHDGSRYQTSSEATLILRLKTECKQLVLIAMKSLVMWYNIPQSTIFMTPVFFCKKAGKNDPQMMGSFCLPHSVSRFIWQPSQTLRNSQAPRLRLPQAPFTLSFRTKWTGVDPPNMEPNPVTR